MEPLFILEIGQALPGERHRDDDIALHLTVREAEAQALGSRRLAVGIGADRRLGRPPLEIRIEVVVGQRRRQRGQKRLPRRIGVEPRLQAGMPEKEQSGALAHLQRAHDLRQRPVGPRQDAAAGGQLEGDQVFGRASGGRDLLRSHRRGVGAGRGRQRGLVHLGRQEPGDRVHVLVEEPPFGIAAPQLPHRENERVERHEDKPRQGDGEQHLQEGETCVLAPHACFPWSFAIRVAAFCRRLPLSVGSDQVGRRSMNDCATLRGWSWGDDDVITLRINLNIG